MPAPHSINLPLTTDTAEALRQLSRKEYRHPREQAVKLLVDGLRLAGALSPAIGSNEPVASPAR